MDKGLSLLMDFYELTMGQAYFNYKKESLATFDLLVREMPANRSYLVAAGLADILDYIKGLRFSAGDLAYLKKQGIFSADFLRYLAGFKFSGDIWAMPEGTIFFADEPLIRVTAPIIEAQVIESFLLSTINLQTMIASKACRIVSSARPRKVYDFSLRRTHGPQAGIKVARASYLAGFSGTSNVLAGKLYGLPIVGTMAHSYIMSFKKEIDSFLAYSCVFPERTTLLVDTYDSKKGIENAVTIGLYLESRGHRLGGIRLDSGDTAVLSKLARKMLDRAGLGYVKVLASGNLDEFKIKSLSSQGARIDSFGVGTNMGTSSDAPSLDVVYKICEASDEAGRFQPKMKLSRNKVTYPGRKQVFRVKDRKGRFIKDILGLDKEDIDGQPLLIKVVRQGKIIYRQPALETIRARLKNSLGKFPPKLQDLSSRYKYPVHISPGLKGLQQLLRHRLGVSR